ncbi:MAG: hypothetical protein JXR63_09255 [Spirochaetales bacterium]|nr:hypothetical protein [Spirochaetales bacterium]
MKKSILLFSIIISLSMFSCKTMAETYMQNGIDLFPTVKLEELSSDDYKILETLRGSAEITYSKDGISGDTGKYGVLNDSLGLVNILNYVTNPKWRLENPETIAKLNANYELIEKANEIQADALWMPRTTKEVIVEKNRTIIRVTVIAKAVQIINK